MLKKIFIFLVFLISFVTFANPPLEASKAFKIIAHKFDPNTVKIQWKIAPNYFLYKNCLQIINTDNKIIQLGDINYPTPEMKTNRQGQVFPVYHHKLSLNVPIISESPGESLIEIRYQGCSDEGFCYPPEHKMLKVAFSKNLEIFNAQIENILPESINKQPTQNSKPKINKTKFTDFNQLFATNNWLVIILTFLGFGLMLAMTPCILPMIPVLSGIIVGHGANITTRRAFLLSFTYVMSMSITYGIIGAVFAILGSNLQIIMQSPVAIVSISVLFVLLALSMFDIYNISLPLSLQNKFANVTKSRMGGHYINAAILGSMSILVLSPCVSAPLIGALSYIAQTGNIALGLISLFFLSFGMGIPLLLIGTSAGKLLPKAGSWMNAVKNIFGILMLGIAIYLIARIIPSFYTMLLWASLCIFSGSFLKPFKGDKSKQDRIKLGLAIILISYGLLILYGASAGNSNPLQPLESSCNNTCKYQIKTTTVKTLPEVQHALTIAKEQSLPAVLYFYADWCASCHVIASTTLKDDAVIQKLANISFIKVDVTKNNTETKTLLNHFHVVAPPTFIFIDKNGNLLPSPQLVGEVSTQTLLEMLDYPNFSN